jgi:hypothetical protein
MRSPTLTRFLALTFATFGVAGVVACKSAEAAAGSCDKRGTDPGYEACHEYESSRVSDGKDFCGGSGKWSDSGCSRSGALGACKSSDGHTVWYYASAKVPNAGAGQDRCGGTWLGPDGNPAK